jgi:hypothetical protein
MKNIYKISRKILQNLWKLLSIVKIKDLKIGYSWIKVVLMEAIIWNLVDFKGQKTRMKEMEVNPSLVMIVEDQIQRRKYLVVSL